MSSLDWDTPTLEKRFDRLFKEWLEKHPDFKGLSVNSINFKKVAEKHKDAIELAAIMEELDKRADEE